MDEITNNLSNENPSINQGEPITQEDIAAVQGFRSGYEGSFYEICQGLGVKDTPEEPIFGPTD